jgi:hypothetical protein
MAEHACETFDFPVKTGSFDFTKVCKRTKEGVSEVLQLAKDKAEKDGTHAMEDEKCKAPCLREIFVDTIIDKIELDPPDPSFPVGGDEMKAFLRNYVSMTVSITWQAGILCFKRHTGTDQPKKPGGQGE